MCGRVRVWGLSVCAANRRRSILGQEIYYSTHQFFLSERSLYLFVFDVSQPNMEQSSRIEFWYFFTPSQQSLIEESV
jgi:hypothetical protein